MCSKRRDPNCNIFSVATQKASTVCFFPPCLGDCNKGSLQFLWFSLCTHKTWEQMFSTWWGKLDNRGQKWEETLFTAQAFPRASRMAERERTCPAMHETWVQSLGQEDPLKKEMAIHSSTLAWETPWTEEPGGLPSMGSQKTWHNLATKQPQQIFASFWIFLCHAHGFHTQNFKKLNFWRE